MYLSNKELTDESKLMYLLKQQTGAVSSAIQYCELLQSFEGQKSTSTGFVRSTEIFEMMKINGR